MQKCLKVG